MADYYMLCIFFYCIFILQLCFFTPILFSLLIHLEMEVRMDLIYLGIVAVFFGLTWLLVLAAEKVR